MKKILRVAIPAVVALCFPLAALAEDAAPSQPKSTASAAASAAPSRGKSCDDLKGEIAAKLDARGVKPYTLTIVGASEAANPDGKVVGSCAGGSRRIVYKRG